MKREGEGEWEREEGVKEEGRQAGYVDPVRVEQRFRGILGGGVVGGGGLLPAIVVVANRWSADGEPEQETQITVLYLQR